MRVQNLLKVVRVGLGASVVLMLAFVIPARAALLELTRAQATVTAGGGGPITQQVELPFHWDRLNKGTQGEAVFELRFDLPDSPSVAWGLYLPRIGNAYDVWVNGVQLQAQGDLNQYNGADYSKVPRYVAIAPGLLQPSNLIRIRIRADTARNGGLSTVWLGPQEEAYSAYLQAFRWFDSGTLAVAGFSLMVGLLALSLWLTQPYIFQAGRDERDPLYLYAALAEIAWSVRVFEVLIESPILPWPWWGLLSVITMSIWGGNMAMFCTEIAGWSRLPAARWLQRWLMFMALAGVVSAIGAMAGDQPVALTVWYAVLGATFLCFGVTFMWRAVRMAPIAHRVVAMGLLLNVLVGLRDIYVTRISGIYGGNSWLRYASILFGLTLAYVVIERFRQASAQSRDLQVTLNERVLQRENELARTYVEFEVLAREQERTAERSRILRDMHDGVGAHITSAMRQLKSGKANPEELLRTLSDSMDQLKMTIDAIHLIPGDITGLLANLRYRLEPRFQASDIELQWDVDLVPALSTLDDLAMRSLQYMVFEALSNVLQHARANLLRIELKATPDGGARLRISDNGCGFDVERIKPGGLASLRDRAIAVGASIDIGSTPQGTNVEILFRK